MHKQKQYLKCWFVVLETEKNFLWSWEIKSNKSRIKKRDPVCSWATQDSNVQHTWLLIVYKNVGFRGEYSAVRLQLVFSCSGFWMQPLLVSLQFSIKTVWLIILTLRNTFISLVYSFGKCKGDREPEFCLPWPGHLQSRSRMSLGTLPEDTSILQSSLGMLELLYLLCSTAVALCSLEEHLKSKSTSVIS